METEPQGSHNKPIEQQRESFNQTNPKNIGIIFTILPVGQTRIIYNFRVLIMIKGSRLRSQDEQYIRQFNLWLVQ